MTNVLAERIFAIETTELSAEEKDNLEASYSIIEDIKQNGSIGERWVSSNPRVFNVLVGLVPEISLNDKVMINEINGLISDEKYRDKFCFLNMHSESSKPNKSLVNIPASRQAFEEAKEEIPDLTSFDTTVPNEEYISQLINLFNNSSPKDKQLYYGILSGFPPSASKDWAESLDDVVWNDFSFSRAEPVQKGWKKGLRRYNDPVNNIMPFAKFKPFQQQPEYSAEGLPKHGFRLREKSLDNPNLKKLYSRFSYIYNILGGTEDINALQTEVIESDPKILRLLKRARRSLG